MDRAAFTNEGFDGSLCRLVSLSRKPGKEGLIRCDGVLATGLGAYPVHWECAQIEPFCLGGMYEVVWGGWPVDEPVSIRIGGLNAHPGPGPQTDVFRCIPPAWLKDADLARQASALWAGLPPGLRHLVAAVLWDAERFECFVRGPSSRAHHHAGPNGNLRHCVEVAQWAAGFAERARTADRGVLAAAALLHDVAKSEEYVLTSAGAHAGWSEEGSLLGHRIMSYGWVVEAMARYQIAVPPRQLLALKHVLLATNGVQDWMGLPQPRMLECELLSAADRVSGMTDYYSQLAPARGGFGRRHESKRLSPFFVRGTEE